MLNHTVGEFQDKSEEKRKGRLRRARRAAQRQDAQRQGAADMSMRLVAHSRYAMPSLDARQTSGVSARYPVQLTAAGRIEAIRSNAAVVNLGKRLRARIWETQDGTVIPITEMGVSHLRATIRMLRHQRSGFHGSMRLIDASKDAQAYENLCWNAAWRAIYLIFMEGDLTRREPGYAAQIARHGERPVSLTPPERHMLKTVYPDLEV